MKALAQLCCLLALTVSLHSELTNNNFVKCNKFFYNGEAPTGFESVYSFNLAYICQRYQNLNRFATLYHNTMRIPIYSAYILNPKGKNRPQGPNFNVEPQLVDRRLNAEMSSEADTLAQMKNLGVAATQIAVSQALNGDYDKSGYVKGHLNPVADQKFIPAKCATCTLTNAVPMNGNFNNGGWKSYEIRVRKTAEKLKCAKMYVLRGVIPGNNWIKTNRVNIPGQVWGAYCCVDQNGKPMASGGGIGENGNGKKVKDISIATLQKKFPGKIQLFNQCQK